MLGSYTSNSTTFIKQFQYLTQSYNLTFHDIYMILSNHLLPEERRQVWEQARLYADYMQMKFTKLLPPTLLEQRWSQSKSHTGIIILQVES